MTRFVGIDPSTKTGFVALDEVGEVLKQKELTGIGDKDPKRMVTLIDEIMDHIKPQDVICIEGFSFNSTGQGEDFQYGLGHGIRNSLFRRRFKYYEAAPSAVKKFVAVTGWVGEPGNKTRVTGAKAKKKLIAGAVMNHFGYTNSSDNIVDAYIMAQISRELWLEGKVQRNLPKYQDEVIKHILGAAAVKQ